VVEELQRRSDIEKVGTNLNKVLLQPAWFGPAKFLEKGAF
jgi:hypothetical protein